MRITYKLILLFSVCIPIAWTQDTKIDKSAKHSIYFEVDNYNLSPSEQASLEFFMRTEGNSDYISKISIAGHTDDDASQQYNLKLSENRVKTVSSIIRKTLPTVLIEEKWLGEDQPLNKNSSLLEKQLNRRVEITIEFWVPDLVEKNGSIRELYKLLEQEKQKICIHPKGDTTIRLEQGTIIYFPAEPFGKLDVPCIEIRAKEFYKKSDMILENLSTTSNGRLLESAGMVYIEAALKDSLIELSSGKKVLVLMPADTLREDMKGFNGERDPHTDIINWQASENGLDLVRLPPGIPCANENLSPQIDNCNRCRFFFCRLGRVDEVFKGMFNGSQRLGNRSFRQCQRRLRRNQGQPIILPPITDIQQINCAKMDSLMKMYGVTDYDGLIRVMNKEKMEKYGVKTIEELQDTLRKIKVAEIERNLKSGFVDQRDLQYYMYNTSRLGWINTDAFSKLTGTKISMQTDLPIDPQTDCKAAFTGVFGILPATNGISNYQFYDVPKGHQIWLIGMRFLNGQSYLSLKKTTSTESVEMAPFREVSLEQLKEELKVIDK